MDKNTQDPKEIERLLATVEDWQEQIKIMEQEPEFAHADFFKLLTSIIEDARAATRPPEMLEKCEQALEQAAELYDKTGRLEFCEWASLLNDYMKTWDEDLWKDDSFENPVLFANPLLQAEIATINRMDEQEPPMERVSAAIDDMSQMLQGLSVTDADSMQETSAAIQQLTEKLGAIKNYMSLFKGATHITSFAKLLDETAYQLQRIADETASLMQNNLDTVLSYLDKEIQKPKYKGLSLKELMEQSKDEDGSYKKGSLFLQACEAASKAMTAGGEIIKVSPSKIAGLEMSLTKISSDIFTNLQIASAEKGNIDGQYVFNDIALAVEKQGDKPRTLYYSAIINTLADVKEIDNALDDYDRRVGDAINTLTANDNYYFSASQLYSVMGNKGENINPNIIKRMDASMKKWGSSWVSINQSEDYPAYIKGTPFGVKYEGQLLYYETVEFISNGKTVEKGYHVLKEPVLLTLGKARNQITTIPREVIATGKRQTKDYLKLQNYLLDRISRMKNPTQPSSNRIKYDSLFDRMGVSKDTHKSKSAQVKRTRILTTMFEELEHYKSKGWISGYKESSNKKGDSGVDIFF